MTVLQTRLVHLWSLLHRICPEGTEVINPAFDIVPKDLITGIITEKGVIDLNNLEKDFKDLF